MEDTYEHRDYFEFDLKKLALYDNESRDPAKHLEKVKLLSKMVHENSALKWKLQDKWEQFEAQGCAMYWGETKEDKKAAERRARLR